jgi:hypothetical protein
VAHRDVREPQEGAGGGVSGSVEASRRHGPFDSRWPKRLPRVAADRPAPALTGLEDVPDGLAWDAFSTSSFPGRRRHDLEAISAYLAYKHGRPWRRSSRPLPRRRSIVPREKSSHGWRRSDRRNRSAGSASVFEVDPVAVAVHPPRQQAFLQASGFRGDASVFRLRATGEARSRLEPALRRNSAARPTLARGG